MRTPHTLGLRIRHPYRLRHAVALFSALAVVATGAVACGTSSGTGADNVPSSSASLATGNTKKGGEVTMLVTGLNGRLDPVAANAFAFTTGGPMNAIYGNLTYLDSATNKIKMGFLQSLTPNGDYTVWTGKLTPGLKFSDDTPFDAEAVVFNLQRHADPTNGSLFLTNAKSLTPKAVDATTFTMTLQSPNVHFDAVFTEDFSYIGSPTAIRAAGSNFGTRPVGAGPFKVQNIDGANAVTLVPNPNYALFAKDEPRLDKLTFQAVADFPKESQALAANQAQIAAPYGGDAIKMFQTLPNTNVLINQTGAGSNVQMSHKRAPFNDPRAREAIDLALDRTAVANAFQPGTPPQTNLFAPNSPYYDTKYDYPKQNRERAQQLFDELAAEGKPVVFEYLAADQTQIQICAQLIFSQLKAYKNVTMTIKTVTTADYIKQQRAGNYQMVPNGLYLVNPIPELEDYYVTGGFLNSMGYSNPKVDAAFKDLHTQADAAKQKEDYAIIQEEVNKDHVAYWAGQGLIGFVANKDLVNITRVNYGNAPLWGPLGYKA
ncbi:ABC transporter substrate-binding protein [Dactylosporangium sp. CA-092794]|uniref:ABC transporter substrate-binding protein n=1 Tax=Dactylosporangium sp. CA-092794 TaxID=3239929 RepID=UPI003D8B7588